MARTRNLKPSFFKDEDLVDLGPLAMLCFAGLWTLADREGRLEDRPRWIKAEIFPYTNLNVEKLLSALCEKRFIIRYESDQARYIQVRTFKKHQNPNVKECASTIPAPYEHSAGTTPASNGHVASTACTLNLKPLTSTLLASKRDSDKIEKGTLDHEVEFQRAWDRWPRKGQTRQPLSQQNWCQVFSGAPDEPALLALIHSGIDKWLNSKNFKDGYVFGFADFLAQRRWVERPEQVNDLSREDVPFDYND